MTANSDELLTVARQAMSRAYAPYSGFTVGAAVRGASGRVYGGCNIENAAYPQGWCAEASAITAMIMAGEQHVIEAAVIGPGAALITLCGGCRQKLREFAAPDIPVHLCSLEGISKTVTLAELLPLSFGPENLR